MLKLPFTIILAAFFLQGYPQNDSLPIRIVIKVDSSYSHTCAKNDFKPNMNDYGYYIPGDSVTQHFYNITMDIKNLSGTAINIWLMSCSWQDNFMLNNPYMFIAYPQVCLRNRATLVTILPRDSIAYKTTLSKSIKFDYPCQNCIYGPQVEETKLGLILVDDVFKPRLSGNDYHVAMTDKSLWQIVWSNPLFLQEKLEPRQFDIRGF